MRKTGVRKIKQDYQCKNLKNPFFQAKKQGSACRFTKLIVTVIIILLILAIWFLLGSNFWRWKNVRVEGLTRISSSEIEKSIFAQSANRRYLFFKESNIFLFDRETARQNILDNYNFVSLQIFKKLPQTLVVKISERPYAFIFQQGTDYYYASADAYVIKEASVSEEDKKKYLVLENKNNSNLIGEKDKLNLQSDYLAFVFSLNSLLVVLPELAPERFIIDQELNSVKVKFINGPIVYFNVKIPADGQVQNLVIVKKEKIKDFNKTNYIDLRYGGRIFIN